MASRNTRRRTNNVTNSVLRRNTQVDQSVSRYDMRFPQNWTVEQLRSELSKNNVPFGKTSKKSKLIQLCRDNGLINPQDSVSDDSLIPGKSADSSEISQLTNTVSQLQQTVAMLSRNMDLLLQNSVGFTQNTISQSTVPVVPNHIRNIRIISGSYTTSC